MGDRRFEMPPSMQETMDLLNATHTWNLSRVDEEDAILVLDGDQILSSSRTPEDVESFLCGCFIATFHGNSLETIRQDIAQGKYRNVYGEDALDLVEGDRRRHHKR